jgi:hypothetical protein
MRASIPQGMDMPGFSKKCFAPSRGIGIHDSQCTIWGRDVNAAVVCNQDALVLVTEFLGVTPSALETVLSYCTVQSSLIWMMQPTTMTTLRKHYPLLSHGLMNTSTNASVKTLSPSLTFLAFMDPRISLPNPIPQPICHQLCQQTPP